jgi:Na+/melibiose symporter-like transporter
MKNYLFYALPALPLALLGLPLYVYLPTFYATDVGLGIFGVGAVLLVARLFDMVSDPLVGYWSDAYFSRKTFMFFGAIFLLVGFYFLTHPTPNAGYFWLFGFSMLVYFGWSLLSIPYYAMGADLGESYEQNTHYASWRELFNIGGVLLALLLPFAFGFSDDASAALWLLNSAIFIALPLALAIFFITINATQIQNHFASLSSSFRLFKSELQSSKHLFGAFFLNSFANAVPATLFLLYVELVIGAKEQAGLLLLLYFFSGVAALLFWNFIAKKTSKKTAWSLSILNAIVFFAFVPFLGEGDFVAFLLITIFSGMSLGADMALPASMQADLAQNSAAAPREMGGTLFGFFAMIVKLSLAFGVGVSFAILGLFDFDAQTPNATSLFVLTLLYGTLPVALKLAALFVLSGYKEKERV